MGLVSDDSCFCELCKVAALFVNDALFAVDMEEVNDRGIIDAELEPELEWIRYEWCCC